MKGKILSNRKALYFVSFLTVFVVVQLAGLVAKADENEVKATYRIFTKESGWLQNWGEQGSDCEEGNKEVLTGIKVMVSTKNQGDFAGGVKYSVFSKENEWGQEVTTGSKAVSGDNPIKAVKMELVEAIANDYNIEYRVCNTENEWTKWGQNGEVIGNIDAEENIIGFQARIAKKQAVTETPQTGDGSGEQQNQGQQNQEQQNQQQNQEQQNQGSNGSDVIEAFYKKAESQIGQKRLSDNTTVYGKWWAQRVGDNAFAEGKWCAMFLSWCASEAGVAEKTVGYFAACSYWQDFYKNNGRWHDKSGYTPERGDIIFFDYDGDGVANHNGLVGSVSGTKVDVIEGNVDDEVKPCNYELSNAKIVGYGKPDYASNAANLEEAKKQQQQQQQQQEQTGSNATGQAAKIMEIAASQIGEREASNGWTKYGQWYQDNIDGSWAFSRAHWCAMFVTWCANKAGVPRDVIKPYAACSVGVSNFKGQGVWHNRSGYTPKKGDVIFFTYSHTGLVDYVEDGYVHTIEGNTSNQCKRRQHALSDGQIKGYGSPAYK